MQPPSGSRTKRPDFGRIVIEQEQTDDRPSVCAGGVQRRIIGDPQIVAKPHQDGSFVWEISHFLSSDHALASTSPLIGIAAILSLGRHDTPWGNRQPRPFGAVEQEMSEPVANDPKKDKRSEDTAGGDD